MQSNAHHQGPLALNQPKNLIYFAKRLTAMLVSLCFERRFLGASSVTSENVQPLVILCFVGLESTELCVFYKQTNE